MARQRYSEPQALVGAHQQVEIGVRLSRLPSGRDRLDAYVRLRAGTAFIDSREAGERPLSLRDVRELYDMCFDALTRHCQMSGGIQLSWDPLDGPEEP